MKKTFLVLSLLCAFLIGCSTTNKDGAVSSSSDTDTMQMRDWADVDIGELQDTKLSIRFNSSVSPIIYFAFNSAALSASSMDILNEQVAWLRDNPQALIVIEGHSDERGTREYNLALSNKRASSVMNYFIANGINPKRIRIIGYGKERPAVEGSNERAWSKNRRAVTIVQ